MEKVNLRFVSMIYFWKDHEPDSVVIANGTAEIIKKTTAKLSEIQFLIL
jgi:hypothetical protein